MKKFWTIYHQQIPDFILEFSATKAMLRLENIGMNCGCEYSSLKKFNNCQLYSRYTHSISVALIVWHFTRDKAQTIAALMHDIATPVFAHSIDFLNDDHEEQLSTEAQTETIIKESTELMKLLERHQLKLNMVSDYHIYPIADNDSPQLSADRLEYSLGNMVNYGFTDFAHAKKYYDDLIVASNEYGEKELCFKDEKIAIEFSKNVLKNSRLYISDEDRYVMQKLADIIKYALEIKVLSTADLYTTEDAVIAKLKKNEQTKTLWQEYKNIKNVQTSKTPDRHKEWLQVNAKKRYIDALVVGKGRVSQLSEQIAKEITELKAINFNCWLSAK